MNYLGRKQNLADSIAPELAEGTEHEEYLHQKETIIGSQRGGR